MLYVSWSSGSEIRDGSEEYSITRWVTKDGLPQNTITAIQQTSDGYMWLGTFNGLVRFDGIVFTTFNIENTPQFKSDYITYLKAFEDGSLWIGTFGGGLLKLQDNRFQNINLGESFDRQTIVSILKLNQEADRFYVLGQRGLFEIDGDNIRLLVKPTGENENLTNIGFSQSGELWIEVSGWYVHSVNSDWEMELIGSNDPTGKMRDQTEEGVGAFDKTSNQISYVAYQDQAKEDRPEISFFPYLQFVQSGSDIWLGGGNLPLTKVESGGLRYVFNTEPFISYPDIITLFVDDYENTWVGMDGGGLVRLRRKSVKAISSKDGLPSNNTVTVFADDDNTIWTGHYGVRPGVFGFSYKDNSIQEVSRWTGVPVSSFTPSASGWVWVGTMGMRVMKLKENHMFHLQGNETSETRNSFQFVRATYEDEKGGLWVGSENLGLKYWGVDNVLSFNTDNGLSHNRVHSIVEDNTGNIWVATADGLNKIQPSGEVLVYRSEHGLGVNAIHCLHVANDGTLCAGTAGGGLSIWDPDQERFVSLKVRNGLLNGVVAQINEDDLGFLWVGTNRGISRMAWSDIVQFSKGDLEFVNSMRFGIDDGMLSEECSGGFQPSCIKDRLGNLWFATVGGLVRIDPSTVTNKKESPVAFVESVILDNQSELVNIQANSQEQKIHLYPENENLEIKYTGLDYGSPEDVVFRYKLEGYDNDWISAGRRRSAFYSHLPPGNYRFKLSSANDLSRFSTSQSNIGFIVHPSWWQRMDFQIGGGIGLFLVLWFFYRRQLNRLTFEKEIKSDYAKRLILYQEKERQRISRELHDGLGQSLLAIKNRSGLALMEGRDKTKIRQDSSFDHFEAITSMAGDALHEVRQISHDLRPLQVDRLGLKRSIESLSQQVAQSSDLIMDLDVEDLDDLFSGDDQTNIWRIAQESLNNIVKHAHASEVSLSFYRKGNRVFLVIQDDGKGIDLTNKTAYSTGLGLRSIQERADILEAELKLESIPGEGLTLLVKIPIEE